MAAAADPSVSEIVVLADICLNGAAAVVSRPGRAVTVSGQNWATCHSASRGRRIAAAPPPPGAGSGAPCPAIDAAGLSRVLRVNASSLTLRGLQLVNGYARAAGASDPGNGGCLLATVAASATLQNVGLFGCRADGGGGGGLVSGPFGEEICWSLSPAQVTAAGLSAEDCASLKRGTHCQAPDGGGGLLVGGNLTASGVLANSLYAGLNGGAVAVIGTASITGLRAVNVTASGAVRHA